jgi:SAM-dependent methyltransferase
MNEDLKDYYANNLSAERLRRCYELAPPRTEQYLEAEIAHVAGRINPTDVVLEIGCGYGRVLQRLAGRAAGLVGVDTSESSLQLGRGLLGTSQNCRLAMMDAASLGFRKYAFDVVLCIQNGLSAFKVDQHELISECIRVTRPGGRVLFSSYSEKFWEHRLEWFRLQSEHGLLGEIDWEATGDGIIVCRDGFRATTIRPDDFSALVSEFRVDMRIEEIDESSLFCEITV